MNASIINTKVTCLTATSLILLSAFSFAGRVQAQPITKTQTSTGQVVDQKQIDALPSTPSATLGTAPGADKSGYSFWFPTPTALRRPYLPDFGAASPITLDAGAFAVDTGFGYNTREETRHDVRRTLDSYDLGFTTVKLGLWNRVDAEVGIRTWRINDLTVKDAAGEDSRTRSGFGDLTTRVKFNLFGDDSVPPPCTPGSCFCGGVSALSVSADMIWPTATCGYSIRGGGFRQIQRQTDIIPPIITTTQTDITTPQTTDSNRRDRRGGNSPNYMGGPSLQYSYRCGCGMELRANSDYILSESDRGCWSCCFGNRLSLSAPVVGRLSALAAVDTRFSTSRDSEVQAQVQGAVFYKFTDNFQAELGSNFGVTKRANDYNPFIRVAARF